jgi:hypothetical protein
LDAVDAWGGWPDVSLTAMGLRVACRYHRLPALLCTGLLALSPVTALAQGAPPQPQAEQHAPGALESAGKWLDRQVDGAKAMFGHVGKGVQDFGHEAGVAARSTADTAKDAAEGVARKLSPASVIDGHEVCKMAPNGAPDCVAAAKAICTAKGFKTGKSVDMTTAETCPAKVYLAGRSNGAECKTETFVSSALCQ